MEKDSINVEVAYATPERQTILRCRVAAGTSIIDAAKQSGITDIFLDLDLDSASFGIWSKAKPAKTIVEAGQRIEIYRPLLADPKESRRRRAEKRTAEQTPAQKRPQRQTPNS